MENFIIPWGEISPNRKEISISLNENNSIKILRDGELLSIDIRIENKNNEYKRYVVGKEQPVYLEPALPELPIVVKPIDELSIIPGNQLEVYLEIPLMIAVTFGPPGKRTTLWEYPFTPLSQSFFGNPDSGELCYSIVSSLSSKSLKSESKHNMALCPLVIMNKSNQILNFERMILRGPFLTIFFGADHIFTSPVTISFKGAEQTSQVVIKKKPQEEIPPMRIASYPRKKEEKSVLKKSFFFLKTLYNG